MVNPMLMLMLTLGLTLTYLCFEIVNHMWFYKEKHDNQLTIMGIKTGFQGWQDDDAAQGCSKNTDEAPSNMRNKLGF